MCRSVIRYVAIDCVESFDEPVPSSRMYRSYKNIDDALEKPKYPSQKVTPGGRSSHFLPGALFCYSILDNLDGTDCNSEGDPLQRIIGVSGIGEFKQLSDLCNYRSHQCCRSHRSGRYNTAHPSKGSALPSIRPPGKGHPFLKGNGNGVAAGQIKVFFRLLECHGRFTAPP